MGLTGFLSIQSSYPSVDPPLRLLSFNVRLDTPEDGDDVWSARRELVASVVREVRPDIVGFQEPLSHQLAYLDDALDHEFAGVGRADGDREGEFTPVGHVPVRLERLAAGTFWLSPTPDEPGSVGWDASCPRIATWAVLSDRDADRQLLVCNTHLDHEGSVARREGVRVVLKRLGEVAARHDPDRVVLMGDFNCTPGSDPYELITGEEVGPALVDARELAAEVAGPVETFHDFDGEPDERIDYVFVDSGTEVRRYETVTRDRDGSYPSDHFPVLATVS